MSLETELRDRLSSAAGRMGRWPDGLVTAEDVIDRRRAERRRRAYGGAVAAAVVTAAVFASTLLPGGSQEAPPAAPSVSAPVDVWSAPTRGSLAGDADVLAAVMAEKWSYGGPPADRRVVFAGDLGTRRWALLAGTVGGELRGQWFTADPADPAAGFTDAGSAPLGVTGISHDAVSSQPDGTLVVVAQPGDEVSVSLGLTVHADGSVHRDWTPLTVDGGVASSSLPWDRNAVQFRVQRGGQTLSQVSVGGVTDYGVDPAATAIAAQAPRRPGDGTTSAAAVRIAVQAAAGPLGLSLAELDPVLLWTGEIADPAGPPRRAVVVAMSTPSGAVLTSTAWGRPDSEPADPAGSREPGASCGVGLSPAGTSIADLVSVSSCVVGEGVVQRQLVVSAPVGVTELQLETAAGPRDPQPLAGSGVVADPGIVTGVVVSGPGVEPRRVAVPEKDPFDVQTD